MKRHSNGDSVSPNLPFRKYDTTLEATLSSHQLFTETARQMVRRTNEVASRSSFDEGVRRNRSVFFLFLSRKERLDGSLSVVATKGFARNRKSERGRQRKKGREGTRMLFYFGQAMRPFERASLRRKSYTSCWRGKPKRFYPLSSSPSFLSSHRHVPRESTATNSCRTSTDI